MATSGWRSLFDSVLSAVRSATRSTGSPTAQRGGGTQQAPPGRDYPGDFKGMPPISYAPHADNNFDPGEIVWAWVPFEEDYSQGKDRPVLLIGTDGPWLLALPLTSKDHDRDAAQERRAGRLWVDIGSGPWDSSGRSSEVRVNRTLRIDPARVRRQACALSEDRFEQVEQAVRAAYRG